MGKQDWRNKAAGSTALTLVPWSISVIDAILEEMNTTCAERAGTVRAVQPQQKQMVPAQSLLQGRRSVRDYPMKQHQSCSLLLILAA